jgi:hypothetical protein
MKVEPQPFRSEKEAAEIIRRFEEKHQLFSYAVKGVSVWQLLRFSIAMDLQNIPLMRAPIPRSLTVKHSIKGLKDVAKLIFSGNKTEYWVSSFVSALRLRQGNCYRDIYFDFLLENVRGGLKIQAMNATGYELQQANAFLKPDIEGAFFSIAGNILARAFPVQKGKGVYLSLSKLINQELGLARYSEKVICRIFSSMYWQSRIYKFLLKMFNARAVFVVDTGEYSLMLACRELGVNFIELQHGIQTPDHPSSLLAGAFKYENNLLIPAFLGLFGEYWKERLADSIMASKGRIYCVGTDMIDIYREHRKRYFTANPSRPVITLTTQGIDTENLISFIREFLHFCESQFRLNIKLHPAYDDSIKQYLDALGSDERCKIISGKENPNTYELIATSDLHLSIASACHYDALGLGVSTVVIGLTGYQLMDDLVVKGDALIAMTPQDLAKIVQGRQFGVVSNEASEKYFKQGFVRNVSELAGIGEYG